MHTGALAGRMDVLTSELRAAGVFVTEDDRDFAAALSAGGSSSEPAAGRRLRIVSLSGGFGVHLADLATERGIEVPTFESIMSEADAAAMGQDTVIANPMDLGGYAPSGDRLSGSERLEIALMYACSEQTDAIALFMATSFSDAEGEADKQLAIYGDVQAAWNKPMFVCGPYEPDEVPALRKVGVEAFLAPTDMITAIDRVLARPPALDIHGPVDRVVAVHPAGQTDESIGGVQALELLSSTGIEFVPFREITTAADVHQALETWGSPVFLKVEAPGVLHKSEFDFVRAVHSAEDADRSYGKLLEAGRSLVGEDFVVIAQQAAKGMEIALGGFVDDTLGPTIMVAAGGVGVEVWRDRQFALSPVTEERATAMLQALRIYPLLAGARSRVAYDIPAAARAIVLLSTYLQEHPDVVGIDINPLVCMPDGGGAIAVDATLIRRRPDPEG